MTATDVEELVDELVRFAARLFPIHQPRRERAAHSVSGSGAG